MASSSQSPHPNSNSASRPNVFHWPPSPAVNESNNINTDITVREIIEKYYGHNEELLKHVLMAKAEEDKKQTAQDILKTEQARIRLRQLDLELMREQSKLTVVVAHTPHVIQQQQQPYYNLAPIQQQVLARITGDHQQPNIPPNKDQHPPASPVIYPHSAHPLCPPDNNNNNHNRLNPPRQYLQLPSTQQPTTPISPGGGIHDNFDSLRKRGRASISYTVEEDNNNKPSHNKVMEALKAKIQRGSSSPLATTAPSSAFRDSTATTTTKRQRTLPKPTTSNEPPPPPPPPQINTTTTNTTTTTHILQPPQTPSPRSAKPILPPIDTSIGRIPTITTTTTTNHHPLISPIKSSSPPPRHHHPYISSVRTATTSSVKSDH